MKQANKEVKGDSREEVTPFSPTDLRYQQQKETPRRINNFLADPYDTWSHEQLVAECKRRGLL